ncbi:hypothetical protein [Treponema sp.]|uniref:hypothetical protein n=1 Tax=Treponema sp. TaxID=166 RepID=UPI00388EA865
MNKNIFKPFIFLFYIVYSYTFAASQQIDFGLDSGISKGKVRLEQYLERADLLKENSRWRDMANEGIQIALCEWEKFYVPSEEKNISREEVLQYFSTQVEARYEKFLQQKLNEDRYAEFYVIVRKELELLSSRLQEKNRGAAITAEDAKKEWNDAAKELVDGYIRDFGKDYDSAWLSEVQKLSDSFERKLVLNELFDRESLKVLSETDHASSIALDLADKAEEKTNRIIDSLIFGLDMNPFVDEKEIEKIKADDWVNKFENEMDKALLTWEEAENKFLESKILWEENVQNSFSSGMEKWESAYNEFLSRKENWKKEISSRVETARLDMISMEEIYVQEVSEKLLEYDEFLKKQNLAAYEIFSSQKETYGKVRNLLSDYRDYGNTWMLLWRNQYLLLCDYWELYSFSKNCDELQSFLSNGSIDIGKIDSSYVSKIKTQVKQVDGKLNDFIKKNGGDIEEFRSSENDLIYFLDGIINCKETENALRNQMLSSTGKVLEDYLDPFTIELNKSKFHLQEKQKEYEIALAVNNYALSATNLTENAVSSDQNLKQALEEFNLACEELNENSRGEYAVYLEKKNALVKDIEENNTDFAFVSRKLKELTELNEKHSKAVEDLNAANLHLEELRLNVRKAQAIVDYGNSIYLGKNDALQNLMKASRELKDAKDNLSLIEEKSEDKMAISDSSINKINSLRKAEENLIACTYIFEETIKQIEDLQRKILVSECETLNKRKDLVFDLKSPESTMTELVKIGRDEHGNYMIDLDLSCGSGPLQDDGYYEEFFSISNRLKENRFSETESYTSAEVDLVEWTNRMMSDWKYFEDVALTALYYISSNGYLDDVDGQNLNPLNRNNSKYVLYVDPSDELGSIGLYNAYRRETMEEAIGRIQGRSGWKQDVARCILYRDSNSLIGHNIERVETYALQYTAFKKLSDKYEDKMDDHSFFPGFFGNRIMDSDGKLAEACMEEVDDLRDQIYNNMMDVKQKLMSANSKYVAQVNKEKNENIQLNRLLYNEDDIVNGKFNVDDFSKVLTRVAAQTYGIDDNEIHSIIEYYTETNIFDDVVAALSYVKSLIEKERGTAYDDVLCAVNSEESILFSLMDMYEALGLGAIRKINLNGPMEYFWDDFLESVNSINFYAGNRSSASQYENYANELNETVLALEKNLSERYREICSIEEYSLDHWKKAEEKINQEYNTWILNFENECNAKREEWNYNYNTFLSDRQKYISRNYLEQTLKAFDIAVESSWANAFYEGYSLEESSERISLILESLHGGDFIRGSFNVNHIADDDLIKVDEIKNEILSEQKKLASKQAAYKAFEVIENKKNEGIAKIKELNRAQKEWEIELVRNNGYSVNGNEIERKVTDGCTLFKVLYQNQSIHMYKDFYIDPVDYSINLSGLNGLCDEAIKDLMTKASNEYSMWEKQVFGSENEDGCFTRHLGDVPVLKSNVDIRRDRKENSFTFNNKGEITLILMDLQWNNLEANAAWAEFEKPAWDQKIFDASWAPTLRTTSTIAAAVAASAVSCGVLSAGASVYTAAALSSAITLSNETAFAGMDVAGGYKTPYEVGKSLAASAVSNAVGIATAGIGDKISKIGSAGGRIGAKTMFEGGKTTFGIAANALIMNDGNIFRAKDSILDKESYGKILSSMTSGSVSSGLDELNLGMNAIKVRGYSTSNVSDIGNFDSFIGDSASSLFELVYNGETTLNIASLKGTGLWEVEIGNDGIKSHIGMNGKNFSINRIMSSIEGLKNIEKNNRIERYSAGNETIASALRLDYGFGNENARKQLEDILDNNTVLMRNDGVQEEYVAKSVLENGKKIIMLGNELDDESYMALGIVLQHEAERNGLRDGELGQIAETILSVASHSAFVESLANDSLYRNDVAKYISSNEILLNDINALSILNNNKDLMEYARYVYQNYDTSEDFWRMTWGGQIINDGQGYLVDENGYYINSDGTHTKYITEKTLGAKGIETGLLNIINNSSNLPYCLFSDEQILAAQKLMIDSGLKPLNPKGDFKNYSWPTDYKGHKLNMYDFMEASGKKVNDEIFSWRYNNTADLVLAQKYGVDLGFNKAPSDYAIPEVLLGKFNDLVTSHGNETKNAHELYDKYRFEINNSDGSVTSLFKLTKDNPFLDKLLGQHNVNATNLDFEIIENLKIISKSGCNFMSTLAVPQLMTGNIFTGDDVIDIWEETNSMLLKYGKTKYDYLVRPTDAFVNDRNHLVQIAMKKMNVESFYTSYGQLRKNDIYTNDRVGFYKINAAGKLYPYHFTVGDKDGNVIYNPGYSHTDIKIMDKIYVGEKR